MKKDQPLGKCRKHPGYQYKQKPRKTTAYPNGCPRCWELWNLATQVEQSAATGSEVSNTAINKEGKNQYSGDIKEYAKRQTKDGRKLVDRLNIISKGARAASTVKDELTATKMLIDIQKDVDVDRPQDIRVLVLNLKETTFKEYQDGS